MIGEHISARPAPKVTLGQHPAFAATTDTRTPEKTVEGRAEITRRSRGMSPRLRIVLLLVDGRRTVAQIRNIATQVGAPETCLDELLALGMVALPGAAAEAVTVAAPIAAVAQPTATAAEAPLAAPPLAAPPLAAPPLAAEPAAEEPIAAHAIAPQPEPAPPEPARLAPPLNALNDFAPTTFSPVLPAIKIDNAAAATPSDVGPESKSSRRLTSELFDEFVRSHEAHADAGPSTLDPATRGGSRLDSMMSSLSPLLESAFGTLGRIAPIERTQDDALEEARRILMREVRAKAPVTGALTLVKLRRVSNREDLIGLFDEVGTHISIPMRRLSTQQTLRHVRALLERSN